MFFSFLKNSNKKYKKMPIGSILFLYFFLQEQKCMAQIFSHKTIGTVKMWL